MTLSYRSMKSTLFPTLIYKVASLRGTSSLLDYSVRQSFELWFLTVSTFTWGSQHPSSGFGLLAKTLWRQKWTSSMLFCLTKALRFIWYFLDVYLASNKIRLKQASGQPLPSFSFHGRNPTTSPQSLRSPRKPTWDCFYDPCFWSVTFSQLIPGRHFDHVLQITF